MKGRNPAGGWESPQGRWPPGRDEGYWHQSWGQPPSYSYPAESSPYAAFNWQNRWPQRPSSIRAAVVFMYVGAGLAGLTLVLGLINGARGASLAGSAVGAALWLWMASANRAGKRSARITATVLFGLDTVGLLLLLPVLHTLQHFAAGVGSSVLLAALSGLIIWLIGLTTIVLLWRKESSDYYLSMASFR